MKCIWKNNERFSFAPKRGIYETSGQEPTPRLPNKPGDAEQMDVKVKVALQTYTNSRNDLIKRLQAAQESAKSDEFKKKVSNLLNRVLETMDPALDRALKKRMLDIPTLRAEGAKLNKILGEFLDPKIKVVRREADQSLVTDWADTKRIANAREALASAATSDTTGDAVILEKTVYGKDPKNTLTRDLFLDSLSTPPSVRDKAREAFNGKVYDAKVPQEVMITYQGNNYRVQLAFGGTMDNPGIRTWFVGPSNKRKLPPGATASR